MENKLGLKICPFCGGEAKKALQKRCPDCKGDKPKAGRNTLTAAVRAAAELGFPTGSMSQ